MSWSYSQLRQIDAVCDAFEQAWPRSPRPEIEHFVQQHPELPRDQILSDLLRLELYLRRERGETPDWDEYCRRFPEDVELLRQVWEEGGESPSRQPTADMVPTTTLEVGKQLGPYRLLRWLGSGGFGAVYLARREPTGEEFALKLLHPHLFGSAARREAFKQDGLTGRALDHPHLVKALSVEQDGEWLYIVQTFVDGPNLADWHRTHQPTPEQLVALLIPVAQALAYLHEHRYVHRDLKPGNILVDSASKAYVSDFGLALHEDEQRRRRGEVAGTRPFMSPEQVRGQTELIDGRTDIWALGVVLYVLLTDRLPFGGPLPRRAAEMESYQRDLLGEIQEHDPKPPRQIRPGISRRLEEICLRCLEKRQRDRYATAGDLAEDLLIYLQRAERLDASPRPGTAAPVVPRGLRSFDQSDAEFFLELLPGPRNSQGIPTSVVFWQQRLQGTLHQRPLEIGALIGPSGSGKSSLVKAGLLPRLGRTFQPIVVEATAHDTEVRLLKELRRVLPDIPPRLSLPETCQWLSEQPQSAERRVLIVIDQFEQWLHAHTELSGTQLLAGLRFCNGTHLQALLLARDDFWMPLMRALDQLEIALQEGINVAAVDRFDREHSRRVLLAFGRALGRLPPEDSDLAAEQKAFLEEAIDGLAENGRIVSVQLAAFAEMMKDRPWTPPELAAVGGAQGVGVALLEEKLGERAPAAFRPHRAAARRVLERLLPPHGSDLKGQSHTLEELQAASGYADPAAFAALLDILDHGLRLLTPYTPDLSYVGPASEGPASEGPASAEHLRGGVRGYQLTHDFLVPAIRDWLAGELRRSRRGRAILQLRERSDDWNARPEPRRLPSLLQWLSIELLVPRSAWSGPQQRLMRAARRKFLIQTAAAAGLGLLSFWSFQETRTQWRTESLRNEFMRADTAELPSLLPNLLPFEDRLWPSLRQAYEQAAPANGDARPLPPEQLRRWLHTALVLARREPARIEPLLDRLQEIPAADLSTIVRQIAATQDAPVTTWEQRLRDAAERQHAAVVPLAILLAHRSAESPALLAAAPEIVRQLTEAPPSHFSYWLHGLSPAGPALRAELLRAWEAGPLGNHTVRDQLAEAAVHLCGQDDMAALPLLVQDASPEQLSILLPVLRAREAAPILADRIRDLQQAPRRAAAPELPASSLREQLSSVGGVHSPHGGLAVAVPPTVLPALLAELATAGYSPRSLRPYSRDGNHLVTLTWSRGDRKAQWLLDVPRAELERAHAEFEQTGLRLHDIAVLTSRENGQPGAPRWYAIWRSPEEPIPPTRLLVDIASSEHDQRREQQEEAGFRLFRQLEREVGGQTLITSLWLQLAAPQEQLDASDQFLPQCSSFGRSRKWEDYGDLFPGYYQTDLSAIPPDPVPVTKTAEEPPGNETGAASSAGDSAPAVRMLGVWRSSAGERYESRQFIGESAEDLREAAARRSAEGLSPSVVVAVPSSPGEPRFSSVWDRETPPANRDVAISRRTAILALAAAHLGDQGPLHQLLAEAGEDRDARSFALEYAFRAKLPSEVLSEPLLSSRSEQHRRGLLLALGNYPVALVPPPVQRQVANWAAQLPDAATQSAAFWCCEQWGLRPEAGPAAGRDASPPELVPGTCYPTSNETVMVVLKPDRFLMGSPQTEFGRSDVELQGWMEIGRTFSLARTSVTVAQFRRFVSDPGVRERLPEAYYGTLRHRSELTASMPHARCPQTGIDRLQAMLYCEWLSEQAGIPPEQRCYPDLWEYLKRVMEPGYRLTADEQRYGYRPAFEIKPLRRTGFRLPSEAEYEFASRAGSRESRHFGDSDELLDAYCWHRGNSASHSHPVGAKKPNDFGLFDVLGNASSYCHDLYFPYTNLLPLRKDTGPLYPSPMTNGSYTQRGGDFESPPQELRSAKRFLVSATNNRFTQGLRVAKTER